MNANAIVDATLAAWGQPIPDRGRAARPMVVVTGGEPTLQLDVPLVRALQRAGFYVAVETNGTNDVAALDRADHVCVSPKRGAPLKVRTAAELKVVLPGVERPGAVGGWSADELQQLAQWGKWGALFVQPQDVVDPTVVGVTALTARRGPTDPAAVQYESNLVTCLQHIEAHPEWRLSTQVHKLVGIP